MQESVGGDTVEKCLGRDKDSWGVGKEEEVCSEGWEGTGMCRWRGV